MYSCVVKTKSAKICLNLNFQGGGVFLGSQIENWYSWQFGQKILEA